MMFPKGTKHQVARSNQSPVQAICPLCRHEFEFAAENLEAKLADASCPSCGLTFAPIATDQSGKSHASPPPPPPAIKDIHDIECWFSSAPTPPRALTDLECVRQWCQKHKTLARSGLFCLVALLVAMAGSLVAVFRTSRLLADQIELRLESEQRMQEAQRTADQQSRDAKDCTSALMSERSARMDAEQQIRAGQLIAQRTKEELRKSESRCAQAEARARNVIAQHLASQAQLASKEYPQHSTLLAAEAVSICLQDAEPPVPQAVQRLWDSVGKTFSHTLRGHQGKITAVAVSSSGRWLATASVDNTARLWDLTAATPASTALVLAGHLGRISAVAFSTDNRWLATGSFDSTVRLWDLAAPRPAANPIVLPSRGERITNLALGNSARWLATTSNPYDPRESTVRLWDLSASDLATGFVDLPPQAGRMRAVTFGPSDRWLATAGNDQALRLWNLNSPSPAANSETLGGREENVHTLKISPDGRWLAAACDGVNQHSVRLWPLPLNGDSSAAKSRLCVGHTAAIRILTMSPDSRWLATASDDKSARIWDLSGENPPESATASFEHDAAIQTATFSADGQWLITGTGNEIVRLWSVGQTGPQPIPVVLRPGQGPTGIVAVSPDGHWLITSGEDGTARLHNLRLNEWVELALKSDAGGIASAASELAPETAKSGEPTLAPLLDFPQEPVSTARVPDNQNIQR